MTFLRSTALWALFLFKPDQSFFAATAVSCNINVYTPCNGRAEIQCHASSVIQGVWVSTNESEVTVVDVNKGQNYSNDPRMWVEIHETPSNGKSKAIVYMNNISFSDNYRYTLFVKVQYGFWGPNYIRPTVTGFCVPHIFVREGKQEIVCRVKGKGHEGRLEWSDSNQSTWTESKVNQTVVDDIVTLTSIRKFDPASNKDYCCRVIYKQQDEIAGPVCLSFPNVEPSLAFSSDLARVQGISPERRRILLLLPFLMTFFIFTPCLLVVWYRWRKLAVPTHRERTTSETPLCE